MSRGPSVETPTKMKMKKEKIKPLLRCRLCNKSLMKEIIHWVIDPENEMTPLGSKLVVLLRLEMEHLIKYSQACCDICSGKIEKGFELLMEVHAANFIIEKMYDSGTEDYSDNIFKASKNNYNSQLYKCGKCEAKLNDMRTFVDHYEYHILKKGRKRKAVHHEEKAKNNSNIIVKFEEKKEGMNFESSEPTESEEKSIKIEVNDVSSGDEKLSELEISYKEFEKEGIKTENKIANAFQAKAKTLNQDIKDVLGAKYFCDYCQAPFKIKYKLQHHILDQHLSCKSNDRVSSLKNEKCGKLLICKYCSSALPPKSFKCHVKKCKASFLSNGNLLCHLCGKSVNHLLMKGHMYLHRELNKGEQTCNICKKVFRTGRSLRSHMILHDDSKKIICEICGVKTHPYSLWKHIKKHKSKEKKCKYCDKAFTFNYMLQAHLKMHERSGGTAKRVRNRLPFGSVHKCPKCEKEFSYVSMLNAHVKEKHNDDNVKVESMFGCKLCEKSFDDQYSLKNHLLLIHEATKDDVSDFKSSMQLGVFHCTLCESVLQSEHGLRFHLKTVHDLQNREMPELMRRHCEKCNRSFTNKAGLTAHIKSVHLNIGLLSCEFCFKTFKRHQGLINHKLIHLGKKPFECELCSRTFRQRSDVIRHLQRHVRDGEATLEEAVARNNSESSKLRKSRIFLKDSTSCLLAK